METFYCEPCEGQGWISDGASGPETSYARTCTSCKGNGKLEEASCDGCGFWFWLDSFKPHFCIARVAHDDQGRRLELRGHLLCSECVRDADLHLDTCSGFSGRREGA